MALQAMWVHGNSAQIELNNRGRGPGEDIEGRLASTMPSKGSLRARAAGVIVAFAVLTAVALAPAASARPHRGHMPWSVLLCKYSDQPAEPQPPAFFASLLTRTGQGGVADYWRDISDGAIDFAGSDIMGWYTMRSTLTQAADKNRGQRIQDCVDAARARGYVVPRGNRVVAVVNAQVDDGADGGRVLLNSNNWNVSYAAHEMAHLMDLNHSYSDAAPDAEYDDQWDLMSVWRVFHRVDLPRFIFGPPGLNAEHRDRMGWLRRDQVQTFGRDGQRSRTVTITNLYQPGTRGIRSVRVPIGSDPLHYYTVELRLKRGWDAAIPADVVLIHEVQRYWKYANSPTTFLLREGPGSGDPLRALTDRRNDITIRVNSIDPASATARVSITSSLPCRPGFVWRNAQRTDQVCVTRAIRERVRTDNDAALARRLSRTSEACRSGFVWRGAFEGDRVCVEPATRTQAREDNAAADTRLAALDVDGPNKCEPGYVFRLSDERDYVCVRLAVRTQTRADNAAAPARRLRGSTTCRPGYVWRHAFPEDVVCVERERRTQARADNAAARSRLLVR